MRKCAVPAATLLAAGLMLAASNSPGAAEESPYLLQGEGEVRVLRGLEPEKSFEPAEPPPEVEETPAAATEPQSEPQPATPQVDSDAFERAEGKWLSEWVTSGGQTTTAKTTFDEYGRMSSIPHRFVTFYSADESGSWQGYWTLAAGRHRCATKQDGSDHWGVVLLQFDATYDHFEGTWDFCGEGDKWEWKGKRVARW